MVGFINDGVISSINSVHVFFCLTILDLWINGGSSICSQLNKEVLRNIKEVFTDLQTQVKLKLLLSFFHIPRRLVDEVGAILSWLEAFINFKKRIQESPTHVNISGVRTRLTPSKTSCIALIAKFLLEIYEKFIHSNFSGKRSWTKSSK